jgi:hypothetical protein
MDGIEVGMILRLSIDGSDGNDIECSVVSDEFAWADDGDGGGSTCVHVCFLEAGAGYSKGEVGWVSLNSFRGYEEEI